MTRIAFVVAFGLMVAGCGKSRVDECEVAGCDQVVIDACVTSVEACETLGGANETTCIDNVVAALDACDTDS